MKKDVLVIVLIIGGLIGVMSFLHMEKINDRKVIKASGTIETTEIEVGSQVGGRIESVHVKEGETVTTKAVLATLDPYQLPAKQAQLDAQLAQAQAHYQLMRNGARTEDIAQAMAQRRQAKANYANAKSRLTRFEALLNQRVISQQEFDDVQRTATAALETLRAAQQQEKKLRNGTRSEEIAAQYALIKSIQAQRQALDTSLSELAIESPCHCQISALDVKPGQILLPSQPLATLIDLNDLWMRVYIPEDRFGQIGIGETVDIAINAFPNRQFKGTVVQLASKAEFTPRNVQTQESRRVQVFGIKIALDNSEGLLRPGMIGDLVFEVPAPQ